MIFFEFLHILSFFFILISEYLPYSSLCPVVDSMIFCASLLMMFFFVKVIKRGRSLVGSCYRLHPESRSVLNRLTIFRFFPTKWLLSTEASLPYLKNILKQGKMGGGGGGNSLFLCWTSRGPYLRCAHTVIEIICQYRHSDYRAKFVIYTFLVHDDGEREILNFTMTLGA